MQIKIKKISVDSRIPTYSHKCDAGADLYSAEDFLLPKDSVGTVSYTHLTLPTNREV